MKLRINQDYEIQSKIGNGQFGEVFKGYSFKHNCNVAIKKLKTLSQQQWKINPKIRRQAEILSKFSHKNLIKYYESIEIENQIFIITEFCEKGNLQSHIQSGPIEELKVFQYFCQIIQAMYQINQKNCMHRDIKPENILFDQNNIIKICDFGLAREIIGTDITKLMSYTTGGSPLYTAPNVLECQQYSGLCDVWSVGVLTHEMLMGTTLLPKNLNFFQLKRQMKKYQKQKYKLMNQELHQFFKIYLPKMITYAESDRISFSQLYEYLNKNKNTIQKEILAKSEKINIFFDTQFKISILGNRQVGKTSMIKRFLGKGMDSNYLPTKINEMYTVSQKYENKSYNFYIWEIVEINNKQQIGRSDLIIIQYDMSDNNSVSKVKSMYQIIKDISKLVIIIGNKQDLQHNQNQYVKMNAFCNSNKILLMTTSAKLNINVDSIWNQIKNILIYSTELTQSSFKKKPKKTTCCF